MRTSPLWRVSGSFVTHVIYGIAFSTLTFRNYYAGIPGELIEPARIDGAGCSASTGTCCCPSRSRPSWSCSSGSFTAVWNDFLFAVVLTNPASWPITVALNNMAGSQIVQWNVQMAGAFLAALPTLIVYILLGRYFLRGMLAGALKG